MAGLYGTFEERLRRLMRDAPGRVTINDGYRSPERSEELWHGIGARKYPDPEVRDNWYARPPSAGGSGSMHNHGFAADLGYASPSVKRWVHENAPRYGLHFPLSNEDWHIELAKPGGGRYSTAEARQIRQSGGGPPPTQPNYGQGGTHVHGAGGGISSATVRRGSRGQSVKELQTKLRSLGHYDGAIDGIFGPKTDAAVRSYQRSEGLSVDGIAGPNTWGALRPANDLPPLPDFTIDTGDNPVALPRTDFRGPGAEKLMVVTDNLGKTFLINTTDESRYPIGGRGALNAALALTGQEAPVTEFDGEPVYLSNWRQGPDIISLFGGPNQIERVVAGQKKLPEELGGRYVANPQEITTGHGETYQPENRYPDEPVPLPADILAQFEQRRRDATRALEQARNEAQRRRQAEESRFEQFRGRLSEQAEAKRRDLASEGAGRNLAFQPAFMGRGQRRIRDARADRMGQYQSERSQRLQALKQMVADAKQQREQTLADIERQKATLRSQPRDYMEAYR